jgi:hypothetical protein
MIRFKEMAYSAVLDPGRMGERWQASAARARIPAPHAAASMLRSAWSKPDWCWPATMNFGPEPAAARATLESAPCLPYPHPRSGPT